MINAPFTSEEYARRVVRTVQIIVASLAMGLIVFAGIAMSLRMNQQQQQPPQQQQQPQNDFLAYFAVGFAAVMLGVRRIVGSSIVTRHRKNIAAGTAILPGLGGAPSSAATDGDRLLVGFRQRTIIESAMVEGPAFFVIVAYLVIGQTWLLGLAAMLLAVLVFPFPTYERVEDWVKYQLELLELEKR
jgi:hypothetical protein